MSIYAIGTIFVQLTPGMNAFILAQGFSKTSMLTVVIGAVTNIVLDPVSIFLFDMGVAPFAMQSTESLGNSQKIKLEVKRAKKKISVFL